MPVVDTVEALVAYSDRPALGVDAAGRPLPRDGTHPGRRDVAHRPAVTSGSSVTIGMSYPARHWKVTGGELADVA